MKNSIPLYRTDIPNAVNHAAREILSYIHSLTELAILAPEFASNPDTRYTKRT
jgi:hypothetical protein